MRRPLRRAPLCLLVGVALLLTGCLGDGDDVQGDEEVAAALLARATASVGEELELTSVTAFEWDRVVIPGSYWSADMVNDLAGVDLPRSIGDAMKTTEDHSMLIFLREGEVVSWTQFPRYFPHGVDLGDISRAAYDADAATFRVVDDPDGYVYLRAIDAPTDAP